MEQSLKQIIKRLEQRTGKITTTKAEPVLPFDKAREIFMAVAKVMYVPDDPSNPKDIFTIDDENRDVIKQLVEYFTGQPEFMKHPKPFNKRSWRKGVALVGNCGGGKSLLMEILRECQFQTYGFINCMRVTEAYEADGAKGIAVWGKGAVAPKDGYKPRHCCFDDLGGEGVANWYGKRYYPMEPVLLDRYEHQKRYGLKTHITTNLSMDQIEELYGQRVRSRLYEMCNIIILGGKATSKDRRK